ncbi:MAG: enoyl-CoA hydratase [Rhizobacter sp.]|nr:enoyl-CoA hydratase [Rhizobacter sp.]
MNDHTNINDRISITMLANGVADVRLTRADKMNALDPAMFDSLVFAGERLKGETKVRAVVISGEGRAFCAGLDMESFLRMGGSANGEPMTVGDAPLAVRTHGIANRAQQVAMTWRDVPVPVIAAVHGVAFGGGLQVALGADMRLVAADTKMSVMEIKWGLVPDMAGALLMTELCRPDVVRELTFTGRIFSGTEAVQMGLATRVCADPLGDALALAADIAARSPHAIRAGKRLLNLALKGDAAATLLAESLEQLELMGSANQAEAVKANMDKRAAVYQDVNE